MKFTSSNAITLKIETSIEDEDLKDRVSFNIALDPEVPEDKVKLSVSKFQGGSAEDLLKFLADVKKVVVAKQWIDKAPQLHAMYGLLLKGQAEALYTRHTNVNPVTATVIKDAIMAMSKEYLPVDCAKNTTRYLQSLKKPIEMSVEFLYKGKDHW